MTLPLRHRAYAGFATATLAVAVGVNLIVFTAVNALWLRPLPFPDAHRLVTFPASDITRIDDRWWVDTFAGAVAGQVIPDADLRPQIRLDDVGRDLETVGVTPGYFPVLGLAIQGRDFTADDNRAGAEPVAIISHRLWSREFGGRSDLIGSVISARPMSLRVIGVAPSGFGGARRGERVDVWIPSTLVRRAVAAKVDWSNLPMTVFARLPAGATVADVDRQFRERTANRRAPAPAAVVPLTEVFGTPASRTIVIREGNALSVVAGLAMLVLAGGCATLAALVLVHYERRRLELAVKIALGASRARLIAELSRELGVIAIAGTIAAVIVAVLGLRAIPPLSLPGGVDLGRLDLAIDWRVLGVAIAATAVTLATAAWLPVSRFTRGRLAGDILAGPAVTASAASQRLRQSLLAVLVSAAIVVLVAAGLFVRAVAHGFGAAPGFDVERTLFVTARVISPWADHGPNVMDLIAERTARVRDALRALPGVEEVADGRPPIDPDASGLLRRPIVVESQGARRELLLGRLEGSPELLRALAVPVLAGRPLTAADGALEPVPAVVTASLAARLWPAQSPLGQVASTSWRGGRLVVVGVASDFVFGSLARPATGVVVTARKDFNYGLEPRFVLRAANPSALVEPVRQRLGAWFFSGFGLTALLLGVGGVFGLVAYLAESRQREFGVRLALGASARDLVRHGLAAALIPVSIGVAGGLVCAALISRLFTSLLTGLSAPDPLTYGAVALAMLGSAAAAALVAAWRLRRIMPTEALRTN